MGPYRRLSAFTLLAAIGFAGCIDLSFLRTNTLVITRDTSTLESWAIGLDRRPDTLQISGQVSLGTGLSIRGLDIGDDEQVYAVDQDKSAILASRVESAKFATVEREIFIPNYVSLRGLQVDKSIALTGGLHLPSGQYGLVFVPKSGQGDTSPLREIRGNLTGLTDPQDVRILGKVRFSFGHETAPPEQEIYVANESTNSVTVYPFSGNGNIPPSRVLSGPQTRLQQPRALALTAEYLYVADQEGAGSVKRFPIGASGDVAPDRVLMHPVGSPNRIVFPQTLFADPNRNELWVGDARPSVKVYRLDTPGGDDPPIKTIGSSAGLELPVAMTLVQAPSLTSLVTSILPITRVPMVGQIAGVFANAINTGTEIASSVGIFAPTSLPAGTTFFRTNPATNAIDGPANGAADIPPGGIQTYALFFTPNATFPPTTFQPTIAGVNTTKVARIPGVNEVTIVAPAHPTVDVVALAATPGTIPGALPVPEGGANAFAVAMVNVANVADTITVTADTGAVTLPLTLSVCQTNPAGQCLASPTASVSFAIAAGGTPTVAVFAAASAPIAFAPADARIFLYATNSKNLRVGGTGVAVFTTPAP